MAYLVLARVELVPAIILSDIGVDVVILTTNHMAIRSAEQLVPSSQLGHIVRVVEDVRSGVGHDNGG